MKIGIIGAGISGLVLGNALKKYDLQFELYEQNDSLNKFEKDIVLTCNASQVLERFDLLKPIIPSTHIFQVDEYSNESLETFFKIEPEKIFDNFPYPFISVTSAHFKSKLAQNIGENKIHYSHCVLDISQRLDKVLVKFANGESAEFDYVVASDGLNSKIRQTIFPFKTSEFSGNTSISILARIDQFPMSHSLALHSIGHGKQFSIHALPEKKWSCEFITPALDTELNNVEKIKEILLRNFQFYNQNILNLIKKHDFDNCLIQKSFRMPGPLQVDCGRIFFIGDAAHLISPIFHQDTAQAIEDAWQLALYLQKLRTDQADVKNFRSERLKRIQFAIQFGAFVQDLGTLQENGLNQIGRTILRKTPNFIYNHLLKKLYQTKD
jgi:2-polyprenyl-6-methoxyphenol hydroxylase-like FAD-dependent oxidoreductase